MLKVYYHTKGSEVKPILHCMGVGTEDWLEAQQAVMDQLYIESTVYLKPVLVLIEGGKA